MKKIVIIDCYGHRNTDTERFRKTEETADEIFETASGDIYLRYGINDNCIIHKITTANGITHRWTYGVWTDREDLTYISGTQDTKAIEVEE